MGKGLFRSTSKDSQGWASLETPNGVPEQGCGAVLPSQAVALRVGEWLPESALRDALIAERLPAALSCQNLFWVNIQQYLNHDDAQLPPEEYLRHWREIYRSCLNQDTARLSGLSYVSVEGPVDGSDLN
jgi:hypothetical protein